MRTRRSIPVLVSLAVAAGLLAVAPSAPAAPAVDTGTAPVVDVITSEDDLTASTDAMTPGLVAFSVYGSGSLLVVQIKGSYSLGAFYRGFDMISEGHPRATRRLNRGATFYGGMFGVLDADPSYFAADLPAGEYLLLDPVYHHSEPLHVAGTPETRALPTPVGSATLTERGIRLPTLARKGWLEITNQTDELTLMDLVLVKKNTTRKQVRAYFRSGGKRFGGTFTYLGESFLLLSPGRAMLGSYALPRGPVVAQATWPSEADGAYQYWRGVWGMTTVR